MTACPNESALKEWKVNQKWELVYKPQGWSPETPFLHLGSTSWRFHNTLPKQRHQLEVNNSRTQAYSRQLSQPKHLRFHIEFSKFKVWF